MIDPEAEVISVRATYDPESHAIYIALNQPRGVLVSEEVDGLIYDRDDGELCGVEVLLSEPLEILTSKATASSARTIVAKSSS